MSLVVSAGCKNRDDNGPAFQPTQNRVSPGHCTASYDSLITTPSGTSVGSTLAEAGVGRYALKKALVMSKMESWGQVQSELVTEDLMFSASPGSNGGQVLNCVSGATLRIPRDNGWISVPQVVEVGENRGRVWQYRYIFHTINNSNPDFRSETQTNLGRGAGWKSTQDLSDELWGYSRCARGGSEVFQINANTYDVVWLEDCGTNSVRYRARYEKSVLP